MTITEAGFIILIALIGGFVQSSTGFGYSLIVMTFWSLLLPLRQAAAFGALTALPLVAYLAFRLRAHINYKILLVPIVSFSIFCFIGVYVLINQSDSGMKQILGVMLILISLFLMANGKTRIKPSLLSGIIVGSLTGILSGMFNIGGPPIVLYLFEVCEDKREYNATLQGFFAIACVIAVILHVSAGNYTVDLLKLALPCIALTGIGIYVGLKVFERISHKHLRRIIYGLMIIMGLYITISN